MFAQEINSTLIQTPVLCLVWFGLGDSSACVDTTVASECTCVRGIGSASYRVGRQTRSESSSMDRCLRRV